MSKTTLVLGASLKTERYSNKAIRLLRSYYHEVIAVGNDEGMVGDVTILNHFPATNIIDTVTLYLRPSLQEQYYNDIISLKPARIIFNPGTENGELKTLAEHAGIHTEEACTLVLLNTGQY